MRQSKFTETQIVSILKEADAGRPVNAIWRDRITGYALMFSILHRGVGREKQQCYTYIQLPSSQDPLY